MDILKSAFVLLLVMLLTGCPKTDRGYVQREWAMSLRELGITPIFPPREDLVVGDIYAYNYDPNDVEINKIFTTEWDKLDNQQKKKRLEIGMSPRLARLSNDFQQMIQEEYSQTVSAPTSTADYNNILGNPALAAAEEQVKIAVAKLKQLQDKIAAAKKEESDAQKNVLDATRIKEDKTTAVEIATEKLNAAKATPPDTSTQEGILKAAKEDLRLKEDILFNAENAFTDAANDQTKLPQATKDKLQAERDKAKASLAVTRAQEDLNAAKAVTVDVSSQQTDLDSAKSELQIATKNLVELERIKADKSASAAAMVEELTAPIAKAEADVTAAKAILTAISKAGTKMLYSQPHDAKSSVYTADALPNPTGGAGDLKNSRVNRLRLVAFPDFVTTSFTQGDLSALIPVEAMLVGLNISSTNVAKVSVKVPAAESYSLSLDKVVAQIAEKKTADGNIEWVMKPELNGVIDAAQFQFFQKRPGDMRGSDTESGNIYLQLITEVYYARAMDITLFSANSFGGRMHVAPPVPLEGDDTLPTITPTTAAPVDSSIADSSVATDMLTSMQNRLGSTQTVPGGSIQVVSYSDQTIGLRRVFDRPIAIGSRGLVLEVSGMKVKRVLVPIGNVPTAVPIGEGID